MARLLASNVLKNAESLRRLLSYLGEQTLAGRADGLKEYTVGTEAFGKPPGYDPKTDSSIRVLVSNLRKKLVDYHLGEGAKDPLVVDLPKGGFKLVFRERSGEDQAQPAGKPAQVDRRWRLAAVILAFVAVGMAATALIWRSKDSAGSNPSDAWASRYWSPGLEALWRPYFEGDRPIIVSLGTPMFLAVPRGFFRDPQYNDWQKAQAAGVPKQLERSLQSGPAAPSYIYTGVGESIGAFRLAMAFGARHRDVSVHPSSDLGWEEISRSDIIFVGPEKFNPQIPELPENRELVIRDAGIKNLRPMNGESAVYAEGRATLEPDGSTMREGYALVTRLVGLHGRGHITILAATCTEGSRAAVEYVTHPAYAEELARKLEIRPGILPEQFQVVLKARYKSYVPVNVSYVTHHVLAEDAGAR
ncbi:MAG: hypothetical protein LLG20_23585 [Acidobacteriales bacterium]|nr:hypothetical protein [Terriglobales bacterium]